MMEKKLHILLWVYAISIVVSLTSLILLWLGVNPWYRLLPSAIGLVVSAIGLYLWWQIKKEIE